MTTPSRPRSWTWLLVALVILQAGAIAALWVRGRWQEQAGGTPVQRGRAIAERMGCFGCHGPDGMVGIPNPGDGGGTVPSWSGGSWMMYNDTEEDIRSWILDGHPPSHMPDPAALLRMPPYGGHLTEAETDDLVAFVLAVSQFGVIDDPKAAAGLQAGQQLGCFGCHGPEGRGLIRNPRSFKGYIPPWDGADYPELVANDDEFRQWVRNGISDRLKNNPAARRILETQAIGMPAYGARVPDEQLDALLAYVRWIRSHPRDGKSKAP